MATMTISTDISCVMTAFTPHGTPPLPTIESPAPMLWRPGMGAGQNKLSQRVRHRGKSIVVDRHDVGAFLVHVTLPPTPKSALENAKQTVESSRKVIFASSKVLVEGKRVAACWSHAGYPTPMTACADPLGLPIAACPTVKTNSACFGMTVGDWIAGCAELALDLVATALGGQNPISAQLFKMGCGFAAGVTRVLLTEGERSADVSIGVPWAGPYLSIGLGVRVTADGRQQLVGATRIGGHEWEDSRTAGSPGVVEHKHGWWTESDDGWAQHEQSSRQGPDGVVAPTGETVTEWGQHPLWGEPLSSGTPDGAGAP